MAQNHSIFIDGIGLSNYRSFGSDIQLIGPFSKVNIFIGPNNSGKSNILRFLTLHYLQATGNITESHKVKLGLEPIDKHLGVLTNSIRLAFAMTPGSRLYESTISKHEARINNKELKESLAKVLNSQTLKCGTVAQWFHYHAHWDNEVERVEFSEEPITALSNEVDLTRQEWINLSAALSTSGGGSDKLSAIRTVLMTLSPFNNADTMKKSPKVDCVQAMRRIEENKEEGGISLSNNLYSGNGLIDKLAKLQNPDSDAQEQIKMLREQFEKINQFLRDVTGESTAKLEIPYKRDSIRVEINGKVLRLSSLGTGIHQVTILAAAATILRE